MNNKDKEAFKKWFEDFWGEEYDSYRGVHKFQEIAYQAACEHKQKEIDELQAENAKLKKFIYTLGHNDQVVDDVIESLEKLENK